MQRHPGEHKVTNERDGEKAQNLQSAHHPAGSSMSANLHELCEDKHSQQDMPNNREDSVFIEPIPMFCWPDHCYLVNKKMKSDLLRISYQAFVSNHVIEFRSYQSS